MNGVLVETDLIVEFLTHTSGSPPLLRRLLEVVVCYSTFIQAAEIYSCAEDEDDRRIVDRALFGLKILGASSRYAKTIGKALSSVATDNRHRTAIVGAMAIESRLPVITDIHSTELRSLPGLHVIDAGSLRQLSDHDLLQRLGNAQEHQA